MLKKTEKGDYELLVKGARFAPAAAQTLKSMLDDGRVTQERLLKMQRIESEAHGHMHLIRERLNVAFITPIDRDDIYRIAKKTGDVTGCIVSAASGLWEMHVNRVTDEMRLMGRLIADACETLERLMLEVGNHKRSSGLCECAAKVRHIRELGDKCQRNAIRELFGREKDPIALIKAQNVYRMLYQAIDGCEDVADCVESVIITKT